MPFFSKNFSAAEFKRCNQTLLINGDGPISNCIDNFF